MPEALSRDGLRDLLWEASGEMIFLHPMPTGADSGLFLEVNDFACQRLGYRRDELCAMGPLDLLVDDDPTLYAERTKTIRHHGRASFIDKLRTKRGEEVVCEIRATLVERGGQPLVISTVLDLTDRLGVEALQRESDRRFRELSRNMPGTAFQMVVARDGTRRFTFIADSCRELVGYTASEILQDASRVFGLVSHAGQQRLDEVSGQPASDLDQTISEHLITRPDGKERWLQVIATPSKRFDGATCWDGLAVDVTERKQVELELVDTRDRMASTLAALPELFFEVDRQGRCFAHAAPDPSLLFSAPEGWGDKPLTDALPADAANIILDAIAEAARTGSHRGATYSLDMGTGLRWFELSIAAKGDVDDPNCRFIVLARDVTERVRAEEELARSEARYRAIVENAYEGIWQIDGEGRTVFANMRMAEMLGYTREEMVGRPFFDFMDEDARKLAGQYFQRRRDGVAEQHEFRFKHRSGRDVWTLLCAAPVDNGEGFDGALAMSIDITERRKSQQALARSERRYHELLEALPDSVFILDREWRHVLVNEAASAFTRKNREELLGRRLGDVFPGVESTGFYAAIETVMQGGAPQVFVDEFRFEDGRRGWYELRILPVPEGVLCISRDVTLRVDAERALRASEEKLSGILDHMHDVVWSMSWPDLRLLYMTPSAEALYGRPVEAFMRDPSLWENVTHPEDRESIDAVLDSLREKGVAERKCRIVRPDGHEVWILDKSHLVRDERGEPIRVDGVASDISEVQILKGLLPICSYCKKIRDDDGYWHEVDQYITTNADVWFSHGLCNGCLERLYSAFAGDEGAER